MEKKKIIIFGGSGFIGYHLVSILKKQDDLKIIIIDKESPRYINDKIEFIKFDLRAEFNYSLVKHIEFTSHDIIVNLIALCKIPGHKNSEYFHTNILSSENIVKFAEKLLIRKIIFLSSMSVYGPREELVNESSIMMPDNPYGVSKVISEKIHNEWRFRDEKNNLLIFRPSIVFGKYEDANMTRLINAIKSKYFFFPGRDDTIKSSVYVKDVASAIEFGLKKVKSAKFKLYNLSNPDLLTIKDIVCIIKDKLNVSMHTFIVPLNIIMFFSHIITIFSRIFFRTKSKFDPDRVKKLTISTNIDTKKLLEDGFKYQYNFADGIEDWMKEEQLDKK